MRYLLIIPIKCLLWMILCVSVCQVKAQECDYYEGLLTGSGTAYLLTLQEKTFFQAKVDSSDITYTWSIILHRDYFWPYVFIRYAENARVVEGAPVASINMLDLKRIRFHLKNDTVVSFTPSPDVLFTIHEVFGTTPPFGTYFVLEESIIGVLESSPVTHMELIFINGSVMNFALPTDLKDWILFGQPFREKDHFVNPQTFFMRYLHCIDPKNLKN